MKKLLFALLLVVVAASCSKEDRIQKNLWKQGGEWDIEVYSWKLGSVDTGINEETYINCGTYTFNKNGTGVLFYKMDGDSGSEAFSYSNTEDKMTIIFGNGSDSYTQVYDLLWTKNRVTLSCDNSYTNPNNNTGYDTENWKLKKKK